VPCVQHNGPIAGYVVRYYATCGPDRDVQQNMSVVTTGSIIDGLTPNTEYVFQVAAVNANGTGPFSEPVTLGGKYMDVSCKWPLQMMLLFCMYRSSTPMELAHSVNLSHGEVMIDWVHFMHYCSCLTMLLFPMYRSSTVSDGQSSELHHCDCLLE